MRNRSEPERPPDFRSCTANLRQNNWITTAKTDPDRPDSKTKNDKIKDPTPPPPAPAPPVCITKSYSNGKESLPGSVETEPLLPNTGMVNNRQNLEGKQRVPTHESRDLVDSSTGPDDQSRDPECDGEDTPLVEPFLEDITEVSESSSSARRSISITEEHVQQRTDPQWRHSDPREIIIDIHDEHRILDDVEMMNEDVIILDENEDVVQGSDMTLNAGFQETTIDVIEDVTPLQTSYVKPADEKITYSDKKHYIKKRSDFTNPGFECTEYQGAGLAQSDSSISSANTNHPYDYGSQSEYKGRKLSSGSEISAPRKNSEQLTIECFNNSAYSPTEVLESPVSWLGNKDAVIDACMIPFEIEGESEIEKNKSSSSEDSEDGKVGESPGLVSTSSESSDLSPMERLQQESGMCYITSGWTYGDFRDGLHEIDDDMFVDEILQIESDAIRMADLSEFSSLPTIPESSRENTDADDESDSRPATSRKASWEVSHVSRLLFDNIKPESLVQTPTNGKNNGFKTNGNVDKQSEKDYSNEVNEKEAHCYVNDVDLSEGDALSEEDENQRFIDERTLLLSSFEGMESTLV